MSNQTKSGRSSAADHERARILLVGVEPWGAIAAARLAASGVGAIHVLDDGAVTADDLAAVPFHGEADLGAPRGEALSRAIARIAPRCTVTTGTLDANAARALQASGERWTLAVAATPGDDLLILQALARFAHAARIASIGARLDGLSAIIGPGVIPGETACWNCERLRTLANSAKQESDLAIQTSLLAERPRPRARTYLAPTAALVGHTLANAALEMLDDPGRASLAGAVLVQNIVSLRAARHPILRMPHCDVCGGAFTGPRPYPAGNGHDLDTARDPAELLEMLPGVVDARTGIVHHVIVQAGVSSRDPELPIGATALLCKYVEDDHHPRCCEPEAGAGKGGSTLRAMLTAVGEAVERYSACRFDTRSMLRASVAEMEGDFLAPEAMGLYSEAQYAEPGFPFEKLDRVTPIDWVMGYWLDTLSPVHLPALPVYLNYHITGGPNYVEAHSNGLGAGPTLSDAAMSAALEMIERDALMISWLARLPGKRVIVDDSVDAGAREAKRQLEDLGARVELYHLDVGLGVPTIVSVGYGDGERWPGATMSLSAHMSPRKAIEKALWEQGHIGPFLRKLVFEEKKHIPKTPDEVVSLEDHALYYVPPQRAAAIEFLGAGGVMRASDLPEPEEISRVELCRRVAKAGLRIAIADVTSPDLGSTPFRVARALGAGFQQVHFGHRIARLGNPRLAAMLKGAPNPDPHPLA